MKLAILHRLAVMYSVFLLTEMNELTKAMKYFNLLLVKAEKDSLAEADVLNEMGFISYCRHERSSALERYI